MRAGCLQASANSRAPAAMRVPGSSRLPAGRLAGFARVSRDRFGQRRPPRRSLEGVAEILRFMGDVVPGELHDAHRERSGAVISDDALADPQISAAADPADREVPIRRVTAALPLDVPATAETLAGLRVVQDGVGRIDGVLGLDVAPLGGVPVFCHPGPVSDVAFHGSAPPVDGSFPVFARWSETTDMTIVALRAAASGRCRPVLVIGTAVSTSLRPIAIA